ncbi:MAG: hypothetical protein ACO2ZM_03480 [Francisellaceae bacterium]
MNRIKITAILLFLISRPLSASSEVDHALIYSTANSALATTNALILRSQGFDPQLTATPYGLVTTINSKPSCLKDDTTADSWQQQQSITDQRNDFMST